MSIMNPMATGIFFDEETVKKFWQAVDSLKFERLDSVQKVIFCGVNRKPALSDIHEEWLGREVTVQVIGYGRNDAYEVFRCQFYPTGDFSFDTFLRKVETPVILVSKAGGTRSSLDGITCWGVESPFFMKGKYGVLTRKGDVAVGEKTEEKK